MANAHRRFNSIDIFKGEWTEVTYPEEIKSSIVNFYHELYKESENCRPDFTLQGIPGSPQKSRCGWKDNLKRMKY